MTTTKKDALNWFELYVADFDRARRFYEAILKAPLQEAPMAGGPEGQKAGCRMAVFPYENMKGVGGAITFMRDLQPGAGGTVIYLNVEGDLDGVLDRIPKAGGTVIKPRMPIGPHGFIGIFKDSEGNVVGLHSMK